MTALRTMRNEESSNRRPSLGRVLSRSLLLLLNIAAIALLFAGAVSCYISPARFTTVFAFLGLLFPVWLVLNIIFCLVWLFCLRWYFLLSLAAMALCYPQVKNTCTLFPDVQQHKFDKHTLSVMTYNVAAFDKYDKNTPTLEYIRSRNADVVCLQEFAVSDNSSYITETEILLALKAYPYHFFTYSAEKAGRHFGVATFSKYPIINSKRISISSKGNAAQYCDLNVDGDTVRVICCHLESFSFNANDLSSLDKAQTNPNGDSFRQAGETMRTRMAPRIRVRAKQAEEIAKLRDESPDKTIICGDFNDTPVSYTYHQIRKSLLDAHVEAERGFGNTYYHNGLGVRIDNILHTKEMHTSQFTTLREGSSDHFPLLATFTW